MCESAGKPINSAIGVRRLAVQRHIFAVSFCYLQVRQDVPP